MFITLSCYLSPALNSHVSIPRHGSKLKIQVVKIRLLLLGDFYKRNILEPSC